MFNPLVKTKPTYYLDLMIIIIPLMNFLTGIALDLYAPSMPAITLYFHTTMSVVQNTITVYMVGFATGCLFFGILFDSVGRRKVILSALLIFIIASLLAPYCHSITQFMAIRFVQGIMTAAFSIGSRTLVLDHFTGQRFYVAVLYTALAYGSGPVIAPFIGGYLQYAFGWQSNFYAYAIFAFIILSLTYTFMHESLAKEKRIRVNQALAFYRMIFANPGFICCTILLGLVNIVQIIYAIIATFLVQHTLGYSSITYGKTALLVGLCYLSSTLLNRALLQKFEALQLIRIGFTIFMVGTIIQFIFAMSFNLSLWTLIIPILIINLSTGFLFPNLLSIALRLFPHNAGIATAGQIFCIILVASLGTFIISHFSFFRLLDLFWLYLIIFLLASFTFFVLFKRYVTTWGQA